MDLLVAQQLLISLGLGMLVGLQRERSESAIGGIRTFPLITLLGTVCAQLSAYHGGWIVGVGFIGVGTLLAIANIPRLREGRGQGMTTEVAVLLLYALGAFLVHGPTWIVVVAVGVVAILLQAKAPLHRFAGAVGDKDMRAIMQFVLISMIILPVLPNQPYGPYGVFNPFEIWLMVALIVGISLAGYVAYKLFGGSAGVLLSGVLGGVISSTATTVASARHSKGAAGGEMLAALVVMVASTVAMLRVLIEIGVVASQSFSQLAFPLAVMLAAMTLIAAGAYFVPRGVEAAPSNQANPAQIKTALVFAVLYAIIKLAVAAARDHFGTGGLYLVAIISGMTDMDAITLSTAKIVEANQLEAATGWRAILIAALSNLAFKGAVVAALGSRKLFTRVALLFSLSGVAGGLILWLCP